MRGSAAVITAFGWFPSLCRRGGSSSSAVAAPSVVPSNPSLALRAPSFFFFFIFLCFCAVAVVVVASKLTEFVTGN